MTYRQEYYRKNKEAELARNKAGREKFIEYARSLKEVPCMDCGIAYPYYVMQFDHRNPADKTAGMDKIMKSGSYDKLDAEVAKCDVVCANCHMERTHGPLQRNGLDKNQAIVVR